MNEILGAVSDNAARTKKRDKAEAEAAEAALREWEAQEERRKARQRRQATRGFLLRAVTAVVAVWALALAERSDLIDPRLASWMVTAVATWGAAWLGAWMQFMWAEGGLFKWK